MLFPDGSRRAGFFVYNVFKKTLTSIDEYDQALEDYPEAQPPEEFREELLNYL